MQGAMIHDMPLLITFIYIKKAFDSINRNMMFAILRHYGTPAKIVAAIRLLYDQSQGQVYIEGHLSEPIMSPQECFNAMS